jgi:hypothetical protein
MSMMIECRLTINIQIAPLSSSVSFSLSSSYVAWAVVESPPYLPPHDEQRRPSSNSSMEEVWFFEVDDDMISWLVGESDYALSQILSQG